MELVCKDCGHREKVNLKFVVKVIGGAVVGTGSVAWVTYAFAGTGFAPALCAALVAGGVGLAAFSNEIAEWVKKKYDCPKCKRRNWVCES